MLTKNGHRSYYRSDLHLVSKPRVYGESSVEVSYLGGNLGPE